MSHEAEIEMLRADLALAHAQIRAMRAPPAGGLAAWLDAVIGARAGRDRSWYVSTGGRDLSIYEQSARWQVFDSATDGAVSADDMDEATAFVLLRHLGVGSGA